MNKDPNELVRVHIWVKGHVHGVGFRAHVEYYALRMGAFGWVRNVGMDTVEAVGEGTRDTIERFIKLFQEGPRSARVDEMRVVWEKPTGEFTGFGVSHNV